MASPVPYEESLFAALDVPTMREIFGYVPVDTRLRCREVCCTWRDLLDNAAPELWCFLDVSQPYSGVSPRNLSMALLRAVAARTGGTFGVINLSNCGTLVYDPEPGCFNPELLSFLSELALMHLIWSDDIVPEVEALSQLFEAASLADKVCVNVYVRSFEQACSMLRHEPPFCALCPHYFCVELSELAETHDWTTFAALLPNFPSLDRLNLSRVFFHEPEHFEAIVDAVIDMGVTCLLLESTTLDPATAAPALSRLLRLGSVQVLHVRQCPLTLPLLDDASFAAELAGALRNDTQLLDLTLGGIGLWDNVTTGNNIVAALRGHPKLRVLALCCNRVEPNQEVSRALLEVVANCPELRVLNIRGVFVGHGDADGFLFDFHEAAQAIKPNLQLPSMDPHEDNASEESVE